MNNNMTLIEVRDALSDLLNDGMSPFAKVIMCTIDREFYIHSVEDQGKSPVLQSDEEDSTGIERS